MKLRAPKKLPIEVLDAQYRLNSACIQGKNKIEIDRLTQELSDIESKCGIVNLKEKS